MEEKKYDIISIGDATQDNFLFIHEASVFCDKNEENCQLCFPYGEKIPVEKFEQSLGGNAANTGVGLSRLGLSTGLLTVLGEDDRATWIYDSLSKEGIDLDLVEFDKRRSNFSVILNFKGERTILVYHEPGGDFQGEIPSTRWIYLTSSSGIDSTAMYGRVLEAVVKNNIKVSFNPGTHECKKGGEHLRSVFEKCEIVVVNKEEAEWLVRDSHSGGASDTGTDSGQARMTAVYNENKNKYMGELLGKLHSFGQKTTVVTNGRDGAWGLDGSKRYFLPILEVPITDPTGAGDSFSAAVTAALFYGKTLGEAMRWGMANAASVVTKVGAIDGLLKRDILERVLEQNQDLKTIEV